MQFSRAYSSLAMNSKSPEPPMSSDRESRKANLFIIKALNAALSVVVLSTHTHALINAKQLPRTIQMVSSSIAILFSIVFLLCQIPKIASRMSRLLPFRFQFASLSARISLILTFIMLSVPLDHIRFSIVLFAAVLMTALNVYAFVRLPNFVDLLHLPQRAHGVCAPTMSTSVELEQKEFAAFSSSPRSTESGTRVFESFVVSDRDTILAIADDSSAPEIVDVCSDSGSSRYTYEFKVDKSGEFIHKVPELSSALEHPVVVDSTHSKKNFKDEDIVQDWQRLIDEETGSQYWYNSVTGQTRWDFPVTTQSALEE